MRKKINYELIDYQIDKFFLPENKTYIIKNLEDMKILDGVLILEDSLKEDYFEKNIILVVCFADGSVPKRIIKDVYFDDETKDILVETNKKDILISTMDYRIHMFLVSIRKKDIIGFIDAKYE